MDHPSEYTAPGEEPPIRPGEMYPRDTAGRAPIYQGLRPSTMVQVSNLQVTAAARGPGPALEEAIVIINRLMDRYDSLLVEHDEQMRARYELKDKFKKVCGSPAVNHRNVPGLTVLLP